jgi:glycosyl transferase family 25
MDIFVINLPSAIERRQFQERQLSKLKLDYQIIRATTTSDIDDKTYQNHYYDWQRPLKKTEVACYFSHQKLWSKIIKNNQVALILEYDALLSKHTPSILEELEKYTNLDMVNLEVFSNSSKKYVAKKSQSINSHKLLRLYRHRLGAGAYVLYPSGAKKLLQYQQKNGIAPADVHLNDCPTLRYQIEPVCAVQLMYCQEYGIKTHSVAISQSSIEHGNDKVNHTFVFGIKKIVGQVKLGLLKLGFIFKAKKRHIELNNEYFE